MKRSRLLHGDPESLGYTPGWWNRHIEELIERRGAHIVLWGDPSPGLLEDVDPARVGHDTMPLTGAMHAAHGGGEVNWTVGAGTIERSGTADTRHRRRRRALGR